MLGPNHYIHFITSASPKVVTQKNLQELLPGSTVTVKYNDEFWETAYSPYEAYLNYFAKKIKEFSLLKQQS
jgi:hypothetical protein